MGARENPHAGLRDFVSTPLPIVVVVFFLIGCLSILMGLLAELMTRTYHEAAGRATFVVREVFREGQSEPPARLRALSAARD